MTLHITKGLDLPDDAVTSSFALLAVRRAGKSNAAVVIAEKMYDAHIPWCTIDPKGDWYGVRSSSDGKGPGLSVVIFGGLHGDVPLEPSAGSYVADLIADQRLTCVLDVSEMSKADQVRFLLAFAQRLLRVNREPLHLFLEECDEYIPQKNIRDDNVPKLIDAMGKLVRRGGFRGIGATLISQRSAVVNKDVLTQVETLIALRTTSPQDRNSILAWITELDRAAALEIVASLPSLANGEAVVWSPSFLGTTRTVKFPRRRTFDSGSTPKMGETRRAPTRLADVDLDAVTAAMAATIERAQAEDPKRLRARIADLERAARDQPRAPAPERIVERVEVPVVSPDVLDELRALRADTAKLTDLGLELAGHADRTLAAVERATHAAPTPHTTHNERPTTPTPTITTRKPRPTSRSDDPEEPPAFRAGARRMLETLARHHPMRVTERQLATLAKFKMGKKGSGTFATYRRELLKAGLIDEHDDLYGITDAGFDYIGAVAAAPMTTDEVLAHWRSILRAGARRMLDLLVDAYPDSIGRDDLATRAAVTETGGTFTTYLSDLRRNGLATIDGPAVRASDTLFLG